MSEECLSKELAETMFMAGVESVMSKKASPVSDIGNGFAALGRGGASLLKDLGIYGVMTGALSGAGYNLIKDRMQETSPKDEFNRKVQAMIASRKRELEDAKWMERVRGMRDELRRNYKKMTPEEYSKKYNDLVSALDERRA